jgi:hypothetical protein
VGEVLVPSDCKKEKEERKLRNMRIKKGKEEDEEQRMTK